MQQLKFQFLFRQRFDSENVESGIMKKQIRQLKIQNEDQHKMIQKIDKRIVNIYEMVEEIQHTINQIRTQLSHEK